MEAFHSQELNLAALLSTHQLPASAAVLYYTWHEDSRICAKIRMECSRKQFSLTHSCCPYWREHGAEIFKFSYLKCTIVLPLMKYKYGECLIGQAPTFSLPAAGIDSYCFPCTAWCSTFLDSIHKTILAAVPEYLDICIIWPWWTSLCCLPHCQNMHSSGMSCDFPT